MKNFSKMILLFTVMLIMFTACDRYEHDFVSNNVEDLTVEEFFNEFSSEVIMLSEENLPNIMNFYHENYNNDGQSKAAILEYYEDIVYTDEIDSVSVELLSYNDVNVEWKLFVRFESNDMVIEDTFEDVLTKVDNSYKFYGNQEGSPTVFVELFTGTWCSNCPKAEEALHELQAEYGSNFSYIEYHVNDPVGLDEYSYLMVEYGSYTPPFTVVQGQGKIDGAETIEQVKAAVKNYTEQYINQPAKAIFKNLNIAMSEDNLEGTVDLEILNMNEIGENTKLCISLIDIENSEVLNYEGGNLHNIGLLREVKDIDLQSGEVTFNIQDINSKLPSHYDAIEDIEDLKIVVWLQNIDFEENSEIYYKIEKNINQ